MTSISKNQAHNFGPRVVQVGLHKIAVDCFWDIFEPTQVSCSKCVAQTLSWFYWIHSERETSEFCSIDWSLVAGIVYRVFCVLFIPTLVLYFIIKSRENNLVNPKTLFHKMLANHINVYLYL